jgi:membrane fusion protein (multidrug efflux system)
MRKLFVLSLVLAVATVYSFSSCNQAKGTQTAPPPPSLPVFPIATSAATTHLEYTATLEGKTNVEIRPQVSGYLDKIYVEEGSFVRAGQPLFKINDRPYDAQLRNTQADVDAARANMEKAAIEVHRLQPLVANHVISDVQLRSAQAAYDQAKAQVSQAEAAGNNAGINLGYTLLRAPVDGFIGRIPFKVGALVGKGEAQPLTVLSDVKEVYAYFSMSENDFLQWSEQAAGKTVQEKIQNMPAVELQMADNSIYGAKGRIQLMEGQFDKTMGTVSFRAVFPNTDGLLRTGSTGKVRIPQASSGVMPVPQQATYELQDKVFVFVVGDSNKVSSQALHIVGKTTGWWLVDKGVKPGDRIVYAGMDRLQDGAVINPQPLKADSIYHLMPL